MAGSSRRKRGPSKSEKDILQDIAHDRVTRETADAMLDHLVAGRLLDAAETPEQKREAEEIRSNFINAVVDLAEAPTAHTRLVLSHVFASDKVERASKAYEVLVSNAMKTGPAGRAGLVELLRRKAWLFEPADPAIAINAYARLLGLDAKDALAHLGLGRLFRQTGDLERALRTYRELLGLPDADPVWRCMALDGLAIVVEALGRPRAALELRDRADRERSAWVDSVGAEMDEEAERLEAATDAELERLEGAADEAAERGDHLAADAALLELLALQEEHSWPEAAAHTVWRLAENAVAMGQLDEAADRFRRAAKAFEGLDDDEGLAGTLWGHGRIASERGELDAAEKLFERALSIEERLRDMDSAVVTMVQLADIERRRGRLPRAIRRFEKALKAYAELGDTKMAGHLSTELADLAQGQGDERTRRRWTERAIEYYEQTGEAAEAALGGQLLKLSALLYETEDYRTVASNAERARAIFERVGDRDLLGRALTTLGAADWGLERYDSAERHYRLASAIYQELYDHRSNAQALSVIGDLAFQRGDVAAARDAWGKALTRYQNVDMWHSEEAQRLRRRLDETR